MNKIFFSLAVCLFAGIAALAQPTIYPAPENKGMILITGATVHTGNGQVMQKADVLINKNKIEKIGANLPVPAGAQVVDASGKHLYPGLINSITNLGIKEVSGGVPGSDDYQELGTINPNIRSLVAYNTSSRIINVLRSHGLLLANVIPQNEQGSNQLISGTSSVVQLDAWNYEDAAYQIDGQMHLNVPSFVNRRRFNAPARGEDPAKEAIRKIDEVKSYLKNAKAYLGSNGHEHMNLHFEALRPLFEGRQKLFVHADAVPQMLVAIDLKKEMGLDVVIVGGDDSWQITSLLKENTIPVILREMHALPAAHDDDVDQPFKTPYILQNAGILFAISDNNNETRGRNLMFNAGTAAAYGLTKEQALSAITLNAARILGIGDRTGSIEVGKDANIIISTGDILDPENSVVTNAFIQGRQIRLENKQTQLAERYKYKYNIK